MVFLAMGCHPATQKEVDALLGKGAIEPCTGGAGLYSDVSMVHM